MFQTTFTMFYMFLNWSPLDLGFYFLGHVAYDTLFLVLYNRDPMMYAHHAVSILTCASMYWFDPVVAFQVATAASFLERSNILLGIVWLLNRAGYGKTLPVQVLGAIALVVYISLRLHWFPHYLLFASSWTVSLLMSPFVPMNFIWSWKLLGYYYHIAFGKKSGAERLE
jgi:hypothetical protein